MNTHTFSRFAGWSAILTGVFGFLYALAYIVVARGNPGLGAMLSALFLLLGGLLTTPVVVELFLRVREAQAGFAFLALLWSGMTALGAAIHGGYDLANALHSPGADQVGLSSLPSQIDPRGLLTFGLAGLGLFFFIWLLGRTGTLGRGLILLGYISAVLLVLIYLARLILLEATNPFLVILVVAEGFLVNPAWYVWLGTTFLVTGKA